MTAVEPTIELTTSPLRRAWIATALMVTLFAVLFIPAIFLVPIFSTTNDGWADLVYFLVAMYAYAIAVVVLIPAVAHTLGRYIDRRTRGWSDAKASLLFAGAAAAIGSPVAVLLTIDSGMGVLPLIQYMLVPGLAAFGTRMLLPVALRVKAVRISAFVLAGAAAAVLAALLVWNVVDNVA